MQESVHSLIGAAPPDSSGKPEAGGCKTHPMEMASQNISQVRKSREKSLEQKGYLASLEV
jgi:hypothetical protein